MLFTLAVESFASYLPPKERRSLGNNTIDHYITIASHRPKNRGRNRKKARRVLFESTCAIHASRRTPGPIDRVALFSNSRLDFGIFG